MNYSKSAVVSLTVALPIIGLVLTSKAPATNSPEAVNSPDRVARGKYLVTISGCGDCHTPLKMGPNGPQPDLSRLLSGHPQDTKLPPPPKLGQGPWFAATAGMTAWTGPWGISYAANLTPDRDTGLGIWTEDIFIRTLRTGKHYGVARDILPPMPWQSAAALTDEDIKAIFAYLRSIPPIKNRVPDPLPPTGENSFE